MKIKITENNKEKLENVLAQANGKARERVAHYEDLLKAVDRIREKFYIPKSKMEGLKVLVDVNRTLKAKAYKHAMYSTKFVVEFGKTDAYLVGSFRDYVEERMDFRVQTFPESVKAAICEKFEKFTIY